MFSAHQLFTNGSTFGSKLAAVVVMSEDSNDLTRLSRCTLNTARRCIAGFVNSVAAHLGSLTVLNVKHSQAESFRNGSRVYRSSMIDIRTLQSH